MANVKRQRQLQRYLRRVDFTLRSAIAATILLLLVGYAIFDFVMTASRKEHQIQESTLRGELGQFLLNTREPDGASLLENPRDFTKARRPAQIVSIRRPFFTYFRTKQNSRDFRTDNLKFDPPPACVVEFLPSSNSSKIDEPSLPLQTCFAAIPADPTGRYVYFALRYPTQSIFRHTQGGSLDSSDRLVLHFVGKKEVTIVLTYQQIPQLKAKIHRVVAMDRLDGVHEIAAYLPEEGGHPTRLLHAQALEQKVSENDKNRVTILGRIDASLLPVDDLQGEWPSPAVKALKIGVEVLPYTAVPPAKQLYGFASNAEGTAQISLEQAYRLAVPSKATLAVTAINGKENGNLIWTSNSLESSEPQRHQGWFQAIANHVAKLMVSGVQKVSVTQDHHLGGLPPLVATLTEDANFVPDIAARSLAWQFAALFVIAALIWLLWGGSTRLQRLTRTAYIAAASRGGSFAEYSNSTDQIGSLGRVLHLLFKRDRLRMEIQRRRLERENQQKAEAIRKERELLETRREILEAIGHEIKSPLANLIANQKSKSDPEVSRNLIRMERAVHTLHEAATIEEGLASGVVAARVDDLGKFVGKLTDNLAERGKPIIGHGERSGVMAFFDDLTLESILDHLLDNAMRHSLQGSTIEVSWGDDNNQAIIEVFNRGDCLEDCENIFKLGVSDPANGGRLGLGLYAVRMYLFGMRGSISAENRHDGVAFVIRLQKTG